MSPDKLSKINFVNPHNSQREIQKVTTNQLAQTVVHESENTNLKPESQLPQEETKEDLSSKAKKKRENSFFTDSSQYDGGTHFDF